ncbi:peptidase family M48-domain-containing protein [Mycena capillaripes]|nr:peptidase family M48-domain-containing protein [Mycena capillaripes]
MNFLNSQFGRVQQQLAFISVDPIDWKFYVQVISWTRALFEAYLLLRQYPLYSKTEPPAAFAAHISASDFEKSQKYGKENAKFALFRGLYKQCLYSTKLHFGFYAWSWDFTGRLMARHGVQDQIIQSIVFLFLLDLLFSLSTLPLELYSTFVLEEKYGFNKTSPGLFIADLLKGWGMWVFLRTPLLWVSLRHFNWVGDQLGGRFMPPLVIVSIFVGSVIGELTLIVIFSMIIQPLFNELSPLAEGELRSRTESLASKLKFPLTNLYEIDASKRSSHSGAYFFGLPWSKHIAIFDTLIQQSQPDEVEAVLAHELGHWYYLHTMKTFAISQLHRFAILVLFPTFVLAPPVLTSFGFSKAVVAQPPSVVVFVLFLRILTPLEAFVNIIMHAVSRHFEWQADRFVCELQDKLADPKMSDMGDRLRRALITIHVKNLSTVWVDWLYSTYHNSHPTLTERLKEIESFRSTREKKVL